MLALLAAKANDTVVFDVLIALCVIVAGLMFLFDLGFHKNATWVSAAAGVLLSIAVLVISVL